MNLPVSNAQTRFVAAPGSDLVVNLTEAERILCQTSLVAVGEYRCGTDHPRFRHGGGPQTCPYIGFARSSVIRIPEGGRSEVFTPNVICFHNIGSSYTRAAVDSCGEECDWLAVSPSLLNDLVEDVFGMPAEDNASFFAAPSAPGDGRLYLAQRRMFEALNSAARPGPLAVEEYCIRVVRCSLRNASRFWDRRRLPQRAVRRGAERRRRSAIENVKEIVARHYSAELSLDHVARLVHYSPGQLAKLFAERTGFTIHGYQQQLRLRTALQMIQERRFELSAVAAELGFSSHSHFSMVFRRRFGISPKQFAAMQSKGLAHALCACIDDSLRVLSTRHRRAELGGAA